MTEQGCVKTKDFEMDYFKFGNGPRTLVMIPGLAIQSVMSAADAVEGINAFMNDDFTSYVFDRKRIIPEGYSIKDIAEDTVAAIKELGLSDLYLFGASQGGMIALTITIEHPELVKKLVLASTSSHVKPEQNGVIDHWIELAKKKDRLGLYLNYGKEIYPPNVYEQYEGFFKDAAATVTDEELEKFVILASSIKGFDISGKLDKIDCPVLVTGAFEDPVLDSDATMEIAENLDYRDDFALYMYTGYGHAAFDTAPDFRKRIYDFYMK